MAGDNVWHEKHWRPKLHQLVEISKVGLHSSLKGHWCKGQKRESYRYRVSTNLNGGLSLL